MQLVLLLFAIFRCVYLCQSTYEWLIISSLIRRIKVVHIFFSSFISMCDTVLLMLYILRTMLFFFFLKTKMLSTEGNIHCCMVIVSTDLYIMLKKTWECGCHWLPYHCGVVTSCDHSLLEDVPFIQCYAVQGFPEQSGITCLWLYIAGVFFFTFSYCVSFTQRRNHFISTT